MITRFLVIAVVALTGIEGYSSGPPRSACNSLMPTEHIKEYDSAVHDSRRGPYQFRVPASVKAGARTTFEITGTKQFRGFIVRVLSSSAYGAGHFINDGSATYRPMKCNKYDDTASHSDGSQKSSVRLVWQAPKEPGNYYVMATIVENLTNAYAGYKAVIRVV